MSCTCKRFQVHIRGNGSAPVRQGTGRVWVFGVMATWGTRPSTRFGNPAGPGGCPARLGLMKFARTSSHGRPAQALCFAHPTGPGPRALIGTWVPFYDAHAPSGPAADSAIIYGVETQPAAFVVDPEGLVRHIQGGSGQKRHGMGGGDDLGDDRNSYDASSHRVPSGFPNGPQTERRKTRTTPKLNAERSPRAPGPGSNAP